MDEEQPAVPDGDADKPDGGDDAVDAQQLLNAATRAIAAVRRQAAGLLRHHRELRGDDERSEESSN